MSVPLLIDTDGGVDDALALLLACKAPGVNLLGVTTVSGNTNVLQATENVLRVLDIGGVCVPVVQGAAEPLSGGFINSAGIHGVDGLGNLERFVDASGLKRYAPVSNRPEDQPACEYIVDLARRYGSSLVIATVGPLTNIACACKLDLEAMRGIGKIVIMGGAVGCPGNITPAAEFNFYADAEAARIVIESGLPVTLVDLGATGQVIFNRSIALKALQSRQSELSQFVADCTELYADFYHKAEGIDGFYLHDPLAVGVAIDPSFVTMQHLHVVVEDQGRYTRGCSLGDLRLRWDKKISPPNCHVVREVDARTFLTFFCHCIWPGLELLD